MAANNINLISPNNKNILGILLVDGTICPVAFMYDRDLLIRDVILQELHLSPIKEVNGNSIYIDENGGQWNSLEVEYHSVLNNIF